jgi:hypothetical protein
MKSRIFGAVLSALILTIAACSSAPPAPPVREADKPKECVFPDAPTTAAPTWVCDERLPNEGLFQAVGSYKLAGNLNLAERAAAANGRVKLALRIQADITSELRDYAKQASTTAGAQVNSGFTDIVTTEFVDKRLTGTYVAKKITSPNSNLYVLVALDPASTKKMLEESLEAAKKKEASLEKLTAEEEFKRLQSRRDKERAE